MSKPSDISNRKSHASYCLHGALVSSIDEIDFDEYQQMAGKWTRAYLYIFGSDLILMYLDKDVNLDLYDQIIADYGDKLLFELPSKTGKHLVFAKDAFTRQEIKEKYNKRITVVNRNDVGVSSEKYIYFNNKITLNYLLQTEDDQ